MKSADDIILQKEWHQLSPGEKDMIRDIAATEKEYHLLKKILQVSADETNDVPALDTSLMQRIQESIGTNKQANKQWYGWLAAACVVGVIIAVMLFNKKESPGTYVKENTEIKQPEIKKDTSFSLSNDSSLANNPDKINSPQKNQVTTIPLQRTVVNDPKENDLAFANVTVEEETGLLDLIIEAE